MSDITVLLKGVALYCCGKLCWQFAGVLKRLPKKLFHDSRNSSRESLLNPLKLSLRS